MPLRNYQIDALDAVRENFREGDVNKQLVIMATGLGKTVFAAHIQSHCQTRGQTVFMAHMNRLVDQSAAQLQKHNPHKTVSIDRAEYQADMNADFVIASAPTIGRGEEFNKRLLRYNPEKIGLVITDEAHHLPGNPMFLNPLRYFRVFKGEPEKCDPSKLLVAITATGNRHDGIGLDTVLDKIVFNMDLRESIVLGWLADIKAFRVETDTRLDDVKMRHGDFQLKDLEDAVNTEKRNRLIVEKYREMGEGKPAIGFTVDIQHSHDLASEFRRSGIMAMPMSGDTPEAERHRIIEEHKNGTIKVITSCGVLSEGADLPWAYVGLMCRPTRSSVLYRQQVGRLTRKYPAPEDGPPVKTTCTIIDFADLTLKHRIITVPYLFGLNPDFNLKGQSALGAVQEIEDSQEKFKQLDLSNLRDLEHLRSTVEEIDLWKPPDIPEIVRTLSRYAWVQSTQNSYRISVPDGPVMSIRENALGRFDVSQSIDGRRVSIRDNVDTLKTAFQLGDAFVPQDKRRLLSSDADWRSGPPTSKQALALARLNRDMFSRFGRDMAKFEAHLRATYNSGQVSTMIEEVLPHRR